MLALQENEEPSQMATVTLERVRRLLQCDQVVQIQPDRLDEVATFVDQIKSLLPLDLAQTVRNMDVCLKSASSRSSPAAIAAGYQTHISKPVDLGYLTSEIVTLVQKT